VLENETAILEFDCQNGNHLVIAMDNEYAYLVCRYGTMAGIELEFPVEKTDAWKQFYYSYYFRAGGDMNEGLELNYLYFENKDHKYVVYQNYYSQHPDMEYGIKIIDLETDMETVIPAELKTVKGSLLPLRDHEMVQEGDKIF